jgi:hypothetical protein
MCLFQRIHLRLVFPSSGDSFISLKASSDKDDRDQDLTAEYSVKSIIMINLYWTITDNNCNNYIIALHTKSFFKRATVLNSITLARFIGAG